MIKQDDNSNIKVGAQVRVVILFREKSQIDIVLLVLPLLAGGAVQDIRCGGVFTSEYNLGNIIGNERC